MRPTFLFIFIALLAPDLGVAQPVSPLPAWYVAAMRQVEEIASELERDRAALIADSNARAVGAIGRVLDQVRAAGVDQAGAQAAIDSLAPYTTAPSPGGPYGGVP